MAVAAPQHFVNPCGGRRWRHLPDGKIEVEGRGIIYPDRYITAYTQYAWQHYKHEIQAAARRRGVLPSWLVGILVVENGSQLKKKMLPGDQTIDCSTGRCCWGVAQIMVCGGDSWRDAGLSRPEDVLDPAKAIDGMAVLLAKLSTKGNGLPGAAAMYNAGSLCCPNAPTTGPTKPGGREWNEYLLCSAKPGGLSYPDVAIMANNYAVEVLGVNRAAGSGDVLLYAVTAFAVVSIAGMLWSARGRR